MKCHGPNNHETMTMTYSIIAIKDNTITFISITSDRKYEITKAQQQN